jgi:hypothetical protein
VPRKGAPARVGKDAFSRAPYYKPSFASPKQETLAHQDRAALNQLRWTQTACPGKGVIK